MIVGWQAISGGRHSLTCDWRLCQHFLGHIRRITAQFGLNKSQDSRSNNVLLVKRHILGYSRRTGVANYSKQVFLLSTNFILPGLLSVADSVIIQTQLRRSTYGIYGRFSHIEDSHIGEHANHSPAKSTGCYRVHHHIAALPKYLWRR